MSSKKREREDQDDQENLKSKEIVKDFNNQNTLPETPDKKKLNKNEVDYDFSSIQKEIQILEKEYENTTNGRNEEEIEQQEETEFGEELEFLVTNFHLKEQKRVFMPYIF